MHSGADSKRAATGQNAVRIAGERLHTQVRIMLIRNKRIAKTEVSLFGSKATAFLAGAAVLAIVIFVGVLFTCPAQLLGIKGD